MITCGQCFGTLQEPVQLPCGHHFCSRCVRTKLDRSGAGDGIICLLCNALHQNVTVRSVQELVDTELANRIALLHRGTDGRPMCQWCEEAPASLHCLDCQYALCSDCNAAVHKNSAKRSHQPNVLDGRSLKTLTRHCGVRGHEEYRLEFYCVRCEQLCCAYCLQIGPHRAHENVLVSKAAADVRQQMGRDLENLGQLKARIDGMASELNRVHGQYLESYDHVETLLTDRFNAFRQQLATKEIEVRKILSSLREVGDQSLTHSREQYLRKLNSINTATLSFRRLQNGGADYEVLQNRAAMSLFLRMEVPTIGGTGFRLSDLGDLNLAGLSISLDLNEQGAPAAPNAGPSSSAARTATPLPESIPIQQRRVANAFTFQADPDIEARETNDGIFFRCSERPSNDQVGIRANETFEQLRNNQLTDQGSITWRVRLDIVNETYIGVADHAEETDGFYWRPMRQATFDGRTGRPTHVLRSLPICRNGDIIKFTYDTNGKVLKLAINNVDRGVIVTDLHSQLSPCFVFRPGEAVTFLL
jgi:hypothetical protein